MATLAVEIEKAEAAKKSAAKRLRELRAKERKAAAAKRAALAADIGAALVDSIDGDRDAFGIAALAFYDARHGAATDGAASEPAPADTGNGWDQ